MQGAVVVSNLAFAVGSWLLRDRAPVHCKNKGLMSSQAEVKARCTLRLLRDNWTSASWSMIPDIVGVALAQLDEREGAAEAQLTLHAALQDEPRICSSCRKEKPAADYDNAYIMPIERVQRAVEAGRRLMH